MTTKRLGWLAALVVVAAIFWLAITFFAGLIGGHYRLMAFSALFMLAVVGVIAVWSRIKE